MDNTVYRDMICLAQSAMHFLAMFSVEANSLCCTSSLLEYDMQKGLMPSNKDTGDDTGAWGITGGNGERTSCRRGRQHVLILVLVPASSSYLHMLMRGVSFCVLAHPRSLFPCSTVGHARHCLPQPTPYLLCCTATG